MKTAMLLMFFMLSVISVANAQLQDDFNIAKSMDINIQLEGRAFVNTKSDYDQMQSLKIDLDYIPREYFMQDLKSFDVATSPDAQIDKGEKLRIEWRNTKEKTIDFSYDGIVNVQNSFIGVDKKIGFPIRTIEAENLKYTGATKFIDLNDDIEKLARELTRGEDDLYHAVYSIAEWTRTNIDYDLNTLTAEAVKPSTWVLANKQGVCDELTNLFISLLRSVGIPARFVSGMVYTDLEKAWGSHGWAEVYFPGYGWVPWDVTFGQYGWIDPSHVKLQSSIDSGTPSIEYTWNAKGIENIDFEKLKVNAYLASSEGQIKSPVKLDIRLLHDSAGLGSYVPVEVIVENTKDYYVSSSLVVTKAPGLTEGNVKNILLGPMETKSVYWILKPTTGMQEGFIYTSMVEVVDMFHNKANALLQYSQEFAFYSEEDAKKIVDSLAERYGKETLEELDISCSTNEESYYVGNNALVRCSLLNSGVEVLDLDVCLTDYCNELQLNPSESKEVYFDIKLSSSGRLSLTAEDDRRVKHEYIPIKVYSIPKVTISSVIPQQAEYGQLVDATLRIYSDQRIRDIIIKTDFGSINVAELDGETDINFELHSRYLIYPFDVEFNYKDEKGKEYKQKEKAHIEVLNVPWYARLFAWLASLI